jgi:hypothetical protein
MKFVNFNAKELLLIAKVLRAAILEKTPELSADEKSQLEPLRARIERKGWS